MSMAMRTNQFSESVIREMTRIFGLYGGVNLAQGFPDFPTPEVIKKAAVDAILSNMNQYSITWGSPRLRQAIANKVKWFPGLDIDPNRHLTITCGATEAITSALMAILNPGDELLVFEPYYENYGPAAILADARPVMVPLHPPEFSFDPQELEQSLSPKTRAIIINTPGNPTGKVFTTDELSFIANICRERDILVVTDEVYEHMTYDGFKHVSIATFPGMFDRTIICNSISKTYCATGWRVGYVIANETITNAIRKIHDFTTLGAPAPLQEGAVAAFNLPIEYYDKLAKDYQIRRDSFLNYLERAELSYIKPKGAYYVLVDISRFGFDRSMDAAIWIIKEVGVAGVPGSSFFQNPRDGEHLIRFHFSKSQKLLDEAGERLFRLRSK